MSYEIKTSRGTVIIKKAELAEGVFPLTDMVNPDGQFIKELNEIHRFLGSQIDIAHLRDKFTPRVEKISNEFRENMDTVVNQFKDQLSTEIDNIIPQDISPFYDPKIIKEEVLPIGLPEYNITIAYYKAPYVEVLETEDEKKEAEKKEAENLASEKGVNWKAI